jgi:hypothetical protein
VYGIEELRQIGTAVNIKTNEEVSVKFKNRRPSSYDFVGKIGTFDGDKNDIQTDPNSPIDTSRQNQSFNEIYN